MPVALVPPTPARETALPAPPPFLPQVPLRQLVETDRFWAMDRLDQYIGNKQDEWKRFDWWGNMRLPGVRGLAPLPNAPGFFVSLDQRFPSARKNLAHLIVSRLTQMSLDGSAFPAIHVEGDEQAQTALREWSKIMELPQKVAEARSKGGANGTACWTLGVSNARFVVDVHNAKHMTVLSWADRQKLIPASAFKAYLFRQDVFEGNQRKSKDFWYVRYWNQRLDITWEAIPAEMADRPDWSKLPPSFIGEHNFGFCPVYWIQNLPESEDVDGQGDYEGTEDDFDEYNRLLSAASNGTIKNVDPTLVIHDEDDGERKQTGSNAVLFAKGGAEYLELKGTAVTASLELLNELRVSILEECQVVNPREDKITGAAQSAAAMRILYAPMISRCNKIRTQYGSGIVRTLQDLLTVARSYRTPVDIFNEAGVVVGQSRYAFAPDLDPGIAELVTLKWPEYFQPTSQDIKDSVTTAKLASGDRPVISHETAVGYTANLFNVQDVEKELAMIDEDADADMERQKEALKTEVSITGGDKGPDE